MFKTWSELLVDAKVKIKSPELLCALETSCSKYSEISFKDLSETPKWPRIFIWNNFILEMLLGSYVLNRQEYAKKVFLFIRELNILPDKGYSFFSSYPPHGPALTIIALATALECFKEKMTEEDVKSFYEVIGYYCSNIYAESKTKPWGDDKPARLMWNHSMVGYAGLYFGGYILSNHHPVESNLWMSLGRTKIHKYFEYGITSCGVNREGFSYAGMTLKAVMPCLYNEILLGKVLSTKATTAMINYVEYVAYEALPKSGLVWNYNDSYMDPRLGLNGYLYAAYITNKIPLASCVWHILLGRNGNKSFGSDKKLWRSSLFEIFLFGELDNFDEKTIEKSLPLSRFFPEKGYFVSKSSWLDSAAIFTFSCGKGIERIHQQSDHNSFTLAVDGVPIVIDSGPSNIKSIESFSQSPAHQSILINDAGMALCGGKSSTSGVLEQYEIDDKVTYIRGNALPAYCKEDYTPLKRAIREVWLVNENLPFYVIHDEVLPIGVEVNIFKWHLHTPEKYVLKSLEDTKAADNVSGCKVFGIFDSVSGCLVLKIHFFCVLPFKFSSIRMQNLKAYDDSLVVNHYRHVFSFKRRKGIFWTLLEPVYNGSTNRIFTNSGLNNSLSSLELIMSEGNVEHAFRFESIFKV